VEELIKEIAPSELAGLHRGKTYFPPVAQPRAWTAGEWSIPPEGRTGPAGVPALRRKLADRLQERGRAVVAPEQVVVTSGATHAVALVFTAVLEPGDEVVILSPQWLFAAGLVRAARGVPREVPVFLAPGASCTEGLGAAIERAITPRTRAIYFNNLNNPTGGRLDSRALERLVELAQRHDLWLVSDNAYENFDFSGEGYPDVADVEGAAARTFSLYSFSKTYSMPGFRVGYLVVPPGLEETMAKWALYSIDGVSSLAQFAAFEALDVPSRELERRRRLAAACRDAAQNTLKIPHTASSGGLFTFLDLTGYRAGPDTFLRRCIEAGVSLAPGEAFGEHCENHARLCYTAVPAEVLTSAIDRINRIYLEGSDGR
jgi:aspartate/methionine/tyrosine aminotransferase